MSAFRKKLVYVYDALCPWCYAFTPVVTAVCRHYGDRLDHEVLSGGMVRGDQVREVGGEEEASRLRESYRSIESLTGAQFGEAFFAGVANHRRRLDSEPPAIALAAFRMVAPGRSELELAHAILQGNFWDGATQIATSFIGRSLIDSSSIPKVFSMPYTQMKPGMEPFTIFPWRGNWGQTPFPGSTFKRPKTTSTSSPKGTRSLIKSGGSSNNRTEPVECRGRSLPPWYSSVASGVSV